MSGTSTRPKLGPTMTVFWIPPAFCGLLSVFMLFLPNGAGAPVFYSFLPMAFFFVAMNQVATWKRMDALQASLEERSRNADATSAAESAERSTGAASGAS